MAKNKLKRFEELKNLERIIQPEGLYLDRIHELRGQWREKVFQNDRPVVLELGCGKGEYTVNLARQNPEMNYIGIDIKGARLWRGVRTINDEHILNAAFLRIQIEQLYAFFDEDEVDEIWLTFPDPQLQKSRASKRLSSTGFLKIYNSILREGGCIHLKTDSRELFDYTNEQLADFGCRILRSSTSIYEDDGFADLREIRTAYEQKFLDEGKPICYLSFCFR